MEVTKWLKPSDSMSRNTVAARVCRPSGWSSLTTPWGFPCFVRFPCVHAVATTPAQRLDISVRSVTQPCQPSPKGLSGRPAHLTFRGLLGFHSRFVCLELRPFPPPALSGFSGTTNPSATPGRPACPSRA